MTFPSALAFISVPLGARPPSSPTLKPPYPPQLPVSKSYTAIAAQLPNDYNLEQIKGILKDMSAEGAIGQPGMPPAVVVFPENSMWGNGACPTAEEGERCLEHGWPSPGALPPRSSGQVDDDVYALADLAASHNIYLVVNVADMRDCPSEGNFTHTLCATLKPGAPKKVSFNTQVVIGPSHNIAGKAFKNQLFADWNTQPTPEMLEFYRQHGVTKPIFEAPELGVNFTTMTCNDANDMALWHGLVEKGVTDVLLSANWDQGPTQQTFQGIMMGLSHFFEMNIVAVSAGSAPDWNMGAGGSSILSNGRILKSLPSSFQPVLAADENVYFCMASGSPVRPAAEDGCAKNYAVSQLTSPPPQWAQPLPRLEDATPSDWPMPDPSEYESYSCYAVWIRALVFNEDQTLQNFFGLSGRGRDLKVENNDGKEYGKHVQKMGNLARCQPLPKPSSAGKFRFSSAEQLADTDAVLAAAPACSVTVDIAELGTKPERFLLQSFRQKVWLPNTPCPFDFTGCMLMHCVSDCAEGDDCDETCSTVPVDSAGYSTFSAMTVEATIPANTDVRPMAITPQLVSLSADELLLDGAFKHDAHAARSADKKNEYRVSYTPNEPSTLGTLGVLGSRVGDGHDWPNFCNSCSRWDNYTACGHWTYLAEGNVLFCAPGNAFMAQSFPKEPMGSETCLADQGKSRRRMQEAQRQ